ncbi:MAG: hypothetical protein AB7G06_03815 [Bdellovibrionales bacterium]
MTLAALCVVLAAPAYATPPREFEPIDPYDRPFPEIPDIQLPSTDGVGNTVGGTATDANEQVVEPVVETVKDLLTDTSQIASAAATALRRDLIAALGVDIANGGVLPFGVSNALVDRHGMCRWLDNASSVDYFVPLRTAAEWAAFVNNAPPNVTRAACCPARSVTLVASDGQSVSFNLDTGREGATSELGVQSLSHVFTLADSSTETVSEVYVCQGEVWTGQGVTRDGEETEEVPGDWANAGCGGAISTGFNCVSAEPVFTTCPAGTMAQESTLPMMDYDCPGEDGYILAPVAGRCVADASCAVPEEPEVVDGCFVGQDLLFIQDVTGSYKDDIPNLNSAFSALATDPRVSEWGFGVMTFGPQNDTHNNFMSMADSKLGSFSYRKLLQPSKLRGNSKSQMQAMEYALKTYTRTSGRLAVVLATDDADFGNDFLSSRLPAATLLRAANAELFVLQGTLPGKETDVRLFYQKFMNDNQINGRIVPLTANSANLYDKIIETVCDGSAPPPPPPPPLNTTPDPDTGTSICDMKPWMCEDLGSVADRFSGYSIY